MASTNRIAMRVQLREAASFFSMVALAALAILLVQHLATRTSATAQAGDRQITHAPAFAASTIAQVGPSDRAAVVTSHFAALNNGDLDGGLAFMASNAVFVGAARASAGPVCTQTSPCTDIAGIRQQLQNAFVGPHVCVTVTSLTVSGAVVTGQRYVTSDNTRKNGIDRDVQDFIALVPENQITFFAALLDIGDAQTARDVAVSAGTEPAGPPIPNPATPCAGV